jgi:hypothetical protein
MAVILQGFFTQPAGTAPVPIRIPLVSDVDRFTVYNITQMAAAQTTAVGVQYYWQRGFPQGAMIEYLKSNAANAANLITYATTGGFTLIDTTQQQPLILNNGGAAITNITNATPPVVTSIGSNLNLLGAGTMVRLYSPTGADEFGGLDFTVGYNALTANTFDLSYMSAGGVGTAGSFRVIPYNPIFYPRVRYIASITSVGLNSVIVTTVTHGLQVGMKVRFKVPKIFAMAEMDTLEGTIIAVNTSVLVNSFTVDIDSSSFTPFVFPVNGNQPFTPAQVIPDGENTAFAANNNLNQLVDATVNVAYIGIQLAAGANSPAGNINANPALPGDTIYWVAEKADSVNTIVPVSLYL